MLNKLLYAAALWVAVSFAYGQAQIIDSQPMGGEASTSSSNNVNSSANIASTVAAAPQAQMYYQLQLLQEEVSQLRGIVEQQSYELKKLKQQRLDDYLDLDRRMSQLGGSGGGVIKTSKPSSSQVNTTSTTGSSASSTATQAKEFSSYQAAIGLALKKRDFDGAVTALQTHLKNFPAGDYAANSQYWLGQIYLQKNELELSKEWFGRMIDSYPKHQKAQEAKFKLGKVLHMLGDKEGGRVLLQEVVDSGASASGLARDYLKQNY